MLKSRDQEAGCRLNLARLPTETCLTGTTLLIQEFRKAQFRCVRWQAFDVNLHNLTFRKATDYVAKIVLQPAHHDFVTDFLRYLDAATESLRVENFQQCMGCRVRGPLTSP